MFYSTKYYHFLSSNEIKQNSRGKRINQHHWQTHQVLAGQVNFFPTSVNGCLTKTFWFWAGTL